MASNPEQDPGHNGHYSGLTGHWLRGKFKEAQDQATKQGLLFYRSIFQNQSPPKETAYRIRRSMRRAPQSGKK